MPCYVGVFRMSRGRNGSMIPFFSNLAETHGLPFSETHGSNTFPAPKGMQYDHGWIYDVVTVVTDDRSELQKIADTAKAKIPLLRYTYM